MSRFRQLVINSVLATDIVDKELKGLRNRRWEVAFSEAMEESPRDNMNRKATIVIEHLIQARFVAFGNKASISHIISTLIFETSQRRCSQ